MFDYFKKIAISNRVDDELLYEYVLTEIENNILVKGLWGKALANSNGNNENAKSIYIKYRVQSIKDIFTAREIAYNELTKSKLFQYIQDKIVPTSNDYTNLTNNIQSNQKIAEDYKVSKYEESIYNEVAKELSNDIRKEGLWLKAIQNTEGDENKALALYIKYRSEAIKVEKEKIIQEKKDEELRNIAYDKKIQEKIIRDREKSLVLFLQQNNMTLTKRISNTKVKANVENSIYDSYIEFQENNWNLVNKILYP